MLECEVTTVSYSTGHDHQVGELAVRSIGRHLGKCNMWY